MAYSPPLSLNDKFRLILQIKSLRMFMFFNIESCLNQKEIVKLRILIYEPKQTFCATSPN